MQVAQDLRKTVHDLYKETVSRMGLALRAICNDFRADEYRRVRRYRESLCKAGNVSNLPLLSNPMRCFHWHQLLYQGP